MEKALNRWKGIGHIKTTPEGFKSRNGNLYTHFTLMVDKDTFVDCETIGKMAARIIKEVPYGGCMARIEGPLHTKVDGQRIKRVHVRIESFEVI